MAGQPSICGSVADPNFARNHSRTTGCAQPLAIAILDKAREPGAHELSGAVLDPSTLRELIPDFEQKGAPLATAVHHDGVYFMTRRGKLRFPMIPPPLRNHGNYVISINK